MAETLPGLAARLAFAWSPPKRASGALHRLKAECSGIWRGREAARYGYPGDKWLA